MKTHEIDGIIYFDEPNIRGTLEFGFDHIGSDYIFCDRDYEKDSEKIVAYAVSEKYNRRLKEVRDKEFIGMKIQHHVGEWMINGI